MSWCKCYCHLFLCPAKEKPSPFLKCNPLFSKHSLLPWPLKDVWWLLLSFVFRKKSISKIGKYWIWRWWSSYSIPSIVFWRMNGVLWENYYNRDWFSVFRMFKGCSNLNAVSRQLSIILAYFNNFLLNPVVWNLAVIRGIFSIYVGKLVMCCLTKWKITTYSFRLECTSYIYIDCKTGQEMSK